MKTSIKVSHYHNSKLQHTNSSIKHKFTFNNHFKRVSYLQKLRNQEKDTREIKFSSISFFTLQPFKIFHFPNLQTLS